MVSVVIFLFFLLSNQRETGPEGMCDRFIPFKKAKSSGVR